MPNWCEQDLIVTGPGASQFAEDVKSEDEVLDTEKIIPMPETIKNTTAGSIDRIYEVWYEDNWKIKPFYTDEETREELKNKIREEHPTEDVDHMAATYKYNIDNYGVKTWYEWAYENWGTKWGICNPELVDKIDERVEYTFRSAWTPVTKIIEEASRKYPQLKFDLEYFEGGAGCQGQVIFKGGYVNHFEEDDYLGPRGG